MILKDIPMGTRKKFTSSYPILYTGVPSSGKTESIDRLSDEEKARTFILNFDSKPVGLDESKYFKVINKVNSSEKLNELLAKATKSNNEEMIKHLEEVLKSSYFIDDEDAIDKICDHILNAAMGPKVDRIVIDTLTEAINFCDAWANEHFSGHEIWKEYGLALMRILNTCKEAVLFGGNFVYITAHNGSIDPTEIKSVIKRVIPVKGGIMKNGVETMVSTVIEAYVSDDETLKADDRYYMRADNLNTMDTTRHKLLDTEINFSRNSIHDLELLLSGEGIIENFKVVSK